MFQCAHFLTISKQKQSQIFSSGTGTSFGSSKLYESFDRRTRVVATGLIFLCMLASPLIGGEKGASSSDCRFTKRYLHSHTNWIVEAGFGQFASKGKRSAQHGWCPPGDAGFHLYDSRETISTVPLGLGRYVPVIDKVVNPDRSRRSSNASKTGPGAPRRPARQ